VQDYPLERSPPEMMLVLDRSESMLEQVPETMRSRWIEISSALREVLIQTDGSVLWGLKGYPTTAKCTVGPTPEVAIGGSSAPVVSAIEAGPPLRGNGTPTAAGIKAAAATLASRPTTNPKYILLATDGQPTCTVENGARDSIAAIAAARAAGLPTFVVGIATAGTAAHTTLNAMAEAGGQARAVDPRYFPATIQSDLVAVLTDITNQVTCTFPLAKSPPLPDDVVVTVDGIQVERDPNRSDGWEYVEGGRAVQLFGEACVQLRARQAQAVNITFGCPPVVIQ